MHDDDRGVLPVGAARPRLLDLVREAIRRRHYSDRTEEAYVHWVKRFVLFSGKRHPAGLGAAEVTAFLNHLVHERNVASSTQNQARAAILFLYKEVLAQPLPWLRELDHAKRPVNGAGRSCSRRSYAQLIRKLARFDAATCMKIF